MATRPSTDPKWAENADAEDIAEPTAERSSGYQQDEVRPSNQFNWLIRELFRWVDYHDDFFQNTTGKIPIYDDSVVAWGDNGDLDKPSDTSSLFEVLLKHTDNGTARFRTGEVSVAKVLTTLIQARTGSVVDIRDDTGGGPAGIDLDALIPRDGSTVKVLDSIGGAYQDLKAQVLEATDYLYADQVWSSTAVFEVLDSAGTALEAIRAAAFQGDVQRPDSGSRIDVNDAGGATGAGEPFSRTNAFAYGKLQYDQANTEWNVIGNALNISSVTGGPTPTTVTFGDSVAVSSPSDVVARADAMENANFLLDYDSDASDNDSMFFPFVATQDDGSGDLEAEVRIIELDLPDGSIETPGDPDAHSIPDGMVVGVTFYRRHS